MVLPFDRSLVISPNNGGGREGRDCMSLLGIVLGILDTIQQELADTFLEAAEIGDDEGLVQFGQSETEGVLRSMGFPIC